MPQCTNYPNSCNGQVIRDDYDGLWYCKKHFSEYDRVKTKFKLVNGEKKYFKINKTESEKIKKDKKDKEN